MEGSASGLNLGWQDRPFRELVRLAWPITVTMLSFSAMSVVDGILVGRYCSAAALAGVGLANLLTFVMICFPLGLLRSTKTLVSQAIGAGRKDEVSAWISTSLVVAVALGGLTVLVGVLFGSHIAQISKDPASAEAARVYLAIRVFGAPFVLAFRGLREVSYAQGDSRTPMVATVTGNVVNAVTAWASMAWLGWGVAGAAACTVLAHGIEAGILLWAHRRAGWRMTGVRAAHLRAMWKMGGPLGLQFVLEVGSFAILTLLLQRLSSTQAAAHQVALYVNHFAFLPAYAVGEAAAVLVGQAVGANRDELVRRISRQAMLLASAYVAACAVVLVVAARPIAAVFTAPGDVAAADLVAASIPLLWVQSAFLLFDAVNIVARSVLSGAGDVRFAAILGVCTAWALTPPMTWILGYHAGLGALGGWIGLCGEVMVGAVILWWRVEKHGWAPAARASRVRIAEDRRPESTSVEPAAPAAA